MEFTKNQKTAIDLRDCNVLVSASAGTGKTAVLTERIVKILLDSTRYEDIDRMLVVTFTRSAAAEMRARISAKLSEKFEEAKRNNESAEYTEHISRQLALLPNAKITTIDSLCFSILKKYYYAIDIDPAVTIIDEKPGRIMLLDVIDAVLESRYEKLADSYVAMVERVATGKNDDDIAGIIEKLYNCSMSHADPVGWLKKSANAFRKYSSLEEISGEFWMKDTMLCEYIKLYLREAADALDSAAKYCEENNIKGIFNNVYDQLIEERNMIRRVAEKDTFAELVAALWDISFGRLTFPRKVDYDAGWYDYFKNTIKSFRKDAKGIADRYVKEFSEDMFEGIVENIAACEVPVKELVDITIQVIDEVSTLRKQENVASFNDVAHYALKIIEQEDILAELRNTYDYVMIDEYQDSNEIQETLLSKISGEAIGNNNRFMVGDAKQSIYMFRLAEPEIFEKKNREYTIEKSACSKVYLDSNFRSSDAILDGVNHIFGELMCNILGGVNYNEGHEFKIDPDINGRKNSGKNEILYVSGDDLPELSDYSKQELEAAAVAGRIKELVESDDPLMIYDEDTECMRPVKYSDIAILLRSKKGWSESFSEALAKNKIPAVTEETTGYFSSFEIQAVLSMLKIIDNPYQDIPFAAALRSSFGNFTDEELALVVSSCEKKTPLYRAVCECAGTEADPGGKCGIFIERLEYFRKKAPYMKVSELITRLAETDNFEDCVSVMTGGDRRSGNLKMLIQQAYEYETSNSRFELFGFLSYVETLQNADIDFGEAPFEQHGEGAVRIMSIHKSKGLEFPVVFVSGMNKGFNFADKKENYIVHAKLGIGPNAFYPETRVKKTTLIRSALQTRISFDTLSEELRLLYVALTRAKNKLIMSGYVADAIKFIDDFNSPRLNFLRVISDKATYLQWVTATALKREDLFHVNIVSADAALLKFGERLLTIRNKKRMLEQYAGDRETGSDILKIIDEQENYIYPYKEETGFAVKVSVSDIKHDKAMEEDEEAVKASWVATERPEYIPRFAAEEGVSELSGAARGTLYHTLMQFIDIENGRTVAGVLTQIEDLISRGILPEEARKKWVINAEKIAKFCMGDAAERMLAAGKKGKLHREQPFVMGVPAAMIYEGTNSTETIIVQGIIDVFFEEEDGIVLLDYKTDMIREDGAQTLINRYRAQMDNYKMAIEKSTGKKVKEIILYSFSLGLEIRL